MFTSRPPPTWLRLGRRVVLTDSVGADEELPAGALGTVTEKISGSGYAFVRFDSFPGDDGIQRDSYCVEARYLRPAPEGA